METSRQGPGLALTIESITLRKMSTQEPSMPDNMNTEDSRSIAAKFLGCLTAYRRLYFFLLTNQSLRAGQIALSEVSDIYGRLNVWGAESGAIFSGRGSLDDRLRTDDRLRLIILDVLGDLEEVLHIAVDSIHDNQAINKDQDATPKESDQDSLSSTSTASEHSIDSESGSRPAKTDTQRLISIICQYVASLNKVSRSLRRSTVHDEMVFRSSSTHTDIPIYVRWDRAHVENKYPFASQYLVRRLGLANTRRRQQLYDWHEHHAIPSQDLSSATDAERLELILGVNHISRSTVRADESVHYSTVAQSSLHDDTSLSGQRNTVYAVSQPWNPRSHTIPNIPNVAPGQTSFECPYCHMQLNTTDMKERLHWKEHVFRDLRPYVCTYEHCPNPEKLYTAKSEWLYHEKQLHQRSWICGNRCDETFKSPQKLKNHLFRCHSGTFTDSQLPVLVDLCERAADPNEQSSCPLCGQKMSLLDLRLHVAFHLEDVAMLVLSHEHAFLDFDQARSATERIKGPNSRNDSKRTMIGNNSGIEFTDEVASSPHEEPALPQNFTRFGPPVSPHVPWDLSCLVLYEPLSPDYNKQPIRPGTDSAKRSFWAPPNLKNAYYQDKSAARLFRWKGGRMIDITDIRKWNYSKMSLYNVATVFTQFPDTPHLLVVPFNATKNDVAKAIGGWNVLSFNHTEGRPVYSSVSAVGCKQSLAAPASPAWLGQLIPQIYDYDPSPNITRPPSAGLIGNLPILFALPAFSAQPHSLSHVLTSCMQPNRWLRHQLPHGHDTERGIVVSVFLDPDNKKGSTKPLLDRLQAGGYGPFYGT